MTGNTLVVTGGTEVFGENAGGSVILKRTAATNWTDSVDTVATGLSAAASTGTTDQLLAVVFPGGSSTGFAAGEAGGIVKTTDTGGSWTLQAGGNGKRFTDSSFINDTTGWMVAMDGSVIKTTNAGGSWTSDASGIAAGTKLRGFPSWTPQPDSLLVIPVCSAMAPMLLVAYKYVSGTWSAMTVPAGVATLEDIQMTSATSGWAVGRAPGDTGAALAWPLKPPMAPTGSLTAAVSTATSGYMASMPPAPATAGQWARMSPQAKPSCSNTPPGRQVRGPSWKRPTPRALSALTWSMAAPVTLSVMYHPHRHLVIIRKAGSYKTIDGGATWNNISPSNTQYRFLVGVSFLDTNTGYVVANEGGRILKTTNGGATWTPDSASAGSNLNTVSVVPSAWSAPGHAVFAAGDNASILRSPAIDETKSTPSGTPRWSPPGVATGAVAPTTGGRYRDYVNGRLYWNQSTGHGLLGPWRHPAQV